MGELNLKVAAEHKPAEKQAGKKTRQVLEVPQEQIRYANLLLYGAWSGIAILVVSFAMYMSGIITPYIHPSRMPEYWGMRASDYLHAANIPTGWGWLKMMGYGDFMNFAGIALLGLLTIGGYLILLPAYLKKKDIPYVAIVALEVLVLTVAASGILGVGAH